MKAWQEQWELDCDREKGVCAVKKKKTYALQFQRMLKCCKVDGRIHGENKRLGGEENVWNANDRINIHSFFFFF